MIEGQTHSPLPLHAGLSAPVRSFFRRYLVHIICSQDYWREAWEEFWSFILEEPPAESSSLLKAAYTFSGWWGSTPKHSSEPEDLMASWSSLPSGICNYSSAHILLRNWWVLPTVLRKQTILVVEVFFFCSFFSFKDKLLSLHQQFPECIEQKSPTGSPGANYGCRAV